MKRIAFVLAIAAVVSSAIPASANNWQWQLNQIKASHLECACSGAGNACARAQKNEPSKNGNLADATRAKTIGAATQK